MTKLTLAEFRRVWSLPTIILGALIVLMGWSIAILPALLVPETPPEAQAAPLKAAMIVYQVENGLLLLVTLFFAAGIVGYDTKSGWLRTLLSRPLTRQTYLAVKIIVVSVSIILVLVIASMIPLPVIAIWGKQKLEFQATEFAAVSVGMVGQCLTYVAICTLLSCFLPGFFNVLFFLAWQIASGLIDFVLNRYLWDSRSAYFLKEILFPTRFTEGIESVMTHNNVVPDLLWGVGLMAMYFALSFWAINGIQVDKTSE